MSRKTTATLIIVILVIAAAVAIYYLTRPAAPVTPAATNAPVVLPTDAPLITDAPPAVTDAPALLPTDAPADLPTAAPAGGGGAPAKVTVWHTFTNEQEAYLKKAAADFAALRPDIQVEILSQPFSGFTANVYSAVIEGIGPDIIFNYASEAAQYVPAGRLADLSQFIYDDELGLEGFDEALAEGVLTGEVNAFEDGIIHYVPAYTTGPILFYNKTLYDELGLEPPRTWEEMEQIARTIYEAKGIPAMGVDSLTDLVQALIMETEGAGYIDVENRQVLFDTPEVREKVRWLVDMVKAGYFALQPSADYFSNDFNSGIIASYVGSSAGYPYIVPDGFEFAMAPMPATTWYPSWNRGPIVFYYGDDARAEAAWEFVRYFISPEVNMGWVRSVTALAPYRWTQDLPEYQAYLGEDTLAAQALQAVQDNLDLAGSLPAVTGSATVRSALQNAIIKAAGGQMTVDQAWDEAVALSNNALQGN
ncbi:MAG TPA: extracellular solute-binding protein [Candidatus Limnocylindria bacterium]|nr:extracellular solute-binding protein [Candidatus Limnocylindria bacterium]